MLPLVDSAKHRRTAVVTGLLVTANLAVFGWEMWLGIDRGERAVAGFVGQHALVAHRLVEHVDRGQEWMSVLTHQFLHGGILHLLGNMWFLWIFGRPVEERLGSVRFLIFYLLSGVVAASAQLVVDPATTVPMLGASGAISGVLGAYLLLFPTAWVWTLVPWIVPIVPVPAVVLLVLWFVVQTLSGFSAMAAGESGGVAWWAHAGGFMAGVAMTAWAKSAGWVRRK
jgi:membrane associated rhomboid family serine protease